MVKHIVLMKLKSQAGSSVRSERADMVKQMIEGLKEKIAEVRSLEVGINFNAEADAYDVALISEFATRKDLETYLNHPDHVAVAAIIRTMRDSRVVVDYET